MTKIILRKNEEKRLLNGHQWIFSNEIEMIENAGPDVCTAMLHDHKGQFIGKGFYNKHSLISYRHLTFKDEEIDKAFIFKRLSKANALRRRLRPDREVYRLSNGEADLLPGLIIDRFDDKYSVQIFSAGMDMMLEDIRIVLVDNFKAGYIVEKNKNYMRELEGIEQREKVLHPLNDNSDDHAFMIEIDGLKFEVNLLKGQKTGFYLDQCENRKFIRSFVRETDALLDLFSNEGGFALNAAMQGVKNVSAVDSSADSIAGLKRNFKLNGFDEPNAIEGDCFEYIDSLFQTRSRFDVIILDPPSFTKSRKTIQTALRAYRDINYKCMKLLKPDSYLFTFSCSHHISEHAFEEMLSSAAAKAQKTLQMIRKHTTSFDHPVLPQMPETSYLKGYLLRVI